LLLLLVVAVVGGITLGIRSVVGWELIGCRSWRLLLRLRLSLLTRVAFKWALGRGDLLTEGIIWLLRQW
jgi:hypothetical protein